MGHDDLELGELIRQYQELERQIAAQQLELSALRQRIAASAKRLGLHDILQAGVVRDPQRRSRGHGSFVLAERQSLQPVRVDGAPVAFRNKMTVLRGPKYATIAARVGEFVLLDEATGEVVVEHLTAKV